MRSRWRGAGRTGPRCRNAGEDGVIRFLYGATLPDRRVRAAPGLRPGAPAGRDRQQRQRRRQGALERFAGHLRLTARPDHASHHQADGCRPRVQHDDRDEPAHLRGQAGLHAARVDAAGRIQLSRRHAAPVDRLSADVALRRGGLQLPTGENWPNLDFGFRLAGDDPRWRPLRVYTRWGQDLHPVSARDGFRQCARAWSASTTTAAGSPARPQQMVNYRMHGRSLHRRSRPRSRRAGVRRGQRSDARGDHAGRCTMTRRLRACPAARGGDFCPSRRAR